LSKWIKIDFRFSCLTIRAKFFMKRSMIATFFSARLRHLHGSLMVADGRLIILGEDGVLVIADATPDVYKEVARIQAVPKKTWVTPVLANGRIYCRNNNGDVVCFDVTGK